MLTDLTNQKAKARLAEKFIKSNGDALGRSEIGSWGQDYVRMHALRCEDDACEVARLAGGFRTSSSGIRVLNVGGAPFLFEYFLRQRFDGELVSLDLNPDRLKDLVSRIGVNVRAVDIELADQSVISALGTFDVVVFCEIFEHLRIDILGTMQRIRGLLRPGGSLYLSMPNGVSAVKLATILLKRRTGPNVVSEWSKLSRLGHMGHVREYSRVEIEEVLRATGFKVERVRYRNRVAMGPVSSFVRALSTKIIHSFGDEIVVIAR